MITAWIVILVSAAVIYWATRGIDSDKEDRDYFLAKRRIANQIKQENLNQEAYNLANQILDRHQDKEEP